MTWRQSSSELPTGETGLPWALNRLDEEHEDDSSATVAKPFTLTEPPIRDIVSAR